MNKKRVPGHHGSILKRQYIEPLSLSVAKLARILGVSRKTLTNILNERESISADMALRLSRAFTTSAELWLNLQRNHDLWQAAQASHAWKKITPIAA